MVRPVVALAGSIALLASWILALTMTHSVLLPLFDQSWRSILNLWGAIAVIAGLWIATTSRQEGKD